MHKFFDLIVDVHWVPFACLDGVQLKTVANIRLRHIVKLLCSCTKGESNLLVYEYMPNGSLGDLLHSPNAKPIPWEMRYKIAVGAATVWHYNPSIMFLNGIFDHSIFHLIGVLGHQVCACGCLKYNNWILHLLYW